jgi:RecJ-like exonuclease
MKKGLVILAMLVIVSVLIVFSQGHKYIGDTKCKMCHIKQYKSWAETKHAKAWDALKPEEQKKEECIQCHVTGYKETEELLKNVQCEACHGPGSDYKDIKIMKDKEKAIAAGLIIPNEETCKKCHNKKSPFFKEFNFEEAKKKGVHELKSN